MDGPTKEAVYRKLLLDVKRGDPKDLLPLRERDYELIDELLYSLGEDAKGRSYALTLGLRYGLSDGMPQTLKKIGTRWGISVERTRQIVVRALRMLRAPNRYQRLRLLFRSELEPMVADLSERCRQQEESIIKALQRIEDYKTKARSFGITLSDTSGPPLNPHINKRMSDFELSVRIQNCFHNAGIATVGQLLQWSESDLLKVKGFGRKCLNDLNHLLEELNLHLMLTNKK